MASGRSNDRFSFFDLPRALWLFLGEERWTFVFFSSVLLVVLGYTLVPPFVVGFTANFLIEWLRSDAAARPSRLPLVWMAIALAVSYGVVAIVRLSSKRVLGRISLNARYRAKVWGFERLLDSSLTWHQQESTGNKAHRVLVGAEAVHEWTDSILINLCQTLATFLGALVAGVWLHPLYALFFAYYLAGLFGIERYFDRRIDALSDRINQSLENASGGFVESASNILSVKALGATDSMTSSVARREDVARALSYERLRLGNSKWMCFQIHNGIGWGLYLLLSGDMVMRGYLLPGFFVTYATYFDKVRDTATEFTDRIQLLIERKSSLGRMMPLFWSNHSLPSGRRRFPTEWRTIQLRDAVFRYEPAVTKPAAKAGTRPAIGPLSVDIARGEVVGIAGPSGSGKSTLIKLLLGLYHLDQGTLTIGEVPVHEISHDELTSHVAVVLQETELFNLTLRENITMMRDVSPGVVQQACVISCLDEVIARLPNGLDTVIGEHGYTLSGGERQRVGIARALCRNAPLLLLDEATSALDSATEQRVMERLLASRDPGRTLLIVAHRISTLKDADRILVFDRGGLVEQGRFAQLAEDPASRFGAMVALQVS